MWRSWTHPRALLMVARCREALGDVAAARAAVAQLLGEWSGADADVPLLAEARAVAARL